MPSNDIPIHFRRTPELSRMYGVLVRLDVAFSNRVGEVDAGMRDRARKHIEAFQEPLRKFLEQDEAVLCIYLATLLPHIAWTRHDEYKNPAILVLGTRGFLHFYVDRNENWRGAVRCARWGDFAELSLETEMQVSRLTTKYHDGKSETYRGLYMAEMAHALFVIQTMTAAGATEISPAHSITRLCAECGGALAPLATACPGCQAPVPVLE